MPLPPPFPLHLSARVQYMDRTYVQQQQKQPVFQLGLELWGKCVVGHKAISQRLQTVLLDLVARERAGETIDRALFRSITQVNAETGLHLYLVPGLHLHALWGWPYSIILFLHHSDCGGGVPASSWAHWGAAWMRPGKNWEAFYILVLYC